MPLTYVVHDGVTLADAAAQRLAETIDRATAARGAATIAVSGGVTPWQMLARLAERPLQWSALTIYQVDERVAPDGDPARNLTHLVAALGDTPAKIVPMDVTATDLEAAAAAYGAALPDRFDAAHLGLGLDGHTASLVPGDPVLTASAPVAVTAPYQGHRRMTLTYPGLRRAASVLWLVSGADKREVLRRLLAGDPALPASHVDVNDAVVVCDAAAAP